MKRLTSCMLMVVLFLLNLSAQTIIFHCGPDSLRFDDEDYVFDVQFGDDLWQLAALETNIDGVRLRGAAGVRARSLFSATVLEQSTGRRLTLNSDNADEVQYELIDNGVALQYFFDDTLMVPLVIYLDESGLHVSIDGAGLQETEDIFFLTIQLLPFLGTASIRDTGYFLVPDGSGALMRFNNGKRGQYSEPVYGQDRSVIRDVRTVGKETIRLPLYGIEKNGRSLLVFAEEGAAMASLVASPSSSANPYNTCFFQFSLRMSEEQAIASDAVQILYESPRAYQGALSVVVKPAGESGYVSMAQTAKESFLSEPGSSRGRPFIMNIIGAELRQFKLLGIPTGIEVSRRLCGYETALGLLDSISDREVQVNFESWNTRQLHGRRVRSAQWDGSLGSRRERARLFSYLEENGIPASVEFNPLAVSGRSGYVIRNLSQQPVPQFRYHYASAYMDAETKSYLLSIDTLDLDVLRDAGPDVAFGGIGQYVYSDFNSKCVRSRDAFVSDIAGRLDDLDDEYVVYGGNFYSLANAWQVLDAPCGSSGFDVMDDTVPFYQMMLSGRISYASDSVNTSERPDWLVLNALETGAALSFDITDSIDLEYVRECLAKYGDDMELVAGEEIVDHEILSAGIRCTTYGNGVSVVVDYTSGSYQIQRGGV